MSVVTVGADKRFIRKYYFNFENIKNAPVKNLINSLQYGR